MAPNSSLTRHRIAILALTGISTALAIYLIRQRYLNENAPPPTSPLRRRNAVRRRGAGRHRRRLAESGTETNFPHSERAISNLRTRNSRGEHYGTVEVYEVRNGTRGERTGEWYLLPFMLPTIEQLQSRDHLPHSEAQRARLDLEINLVRTFLEREFDVDNQPPLTAAELQYLARELSSMGISDAALEGFGRMASSVSEDSDASPNDRRSSRQPTRPIATADGATDRTEVGAMIQALDGRETVADDQSHFSWQDDNRNNNDRAHNMLNLLYRIAEDQARKEGYVHRSVECNSCGAFPILGIRYSCANCADYDLCENCEAQQVHTKTHIFYKIRIPAPSFWLPRQAMPVWYPGRPGSMPQTMPEALSKRLLRDVSLDPQELEALWEQFRCIAGCNWPKDPNHLEMAIDRGIFDKWFVPPSSLRSPPPNLIYDRLFAFYDTNGDGFIGFEEFVRGHANLQDKTRHAKLRRIFDAHDLDNDGFVDRKDFLRMFRAYYSLCKEHNRDMVAGMEDEFIEENAREVIQSSQPISSAFPGHIPPGQCSRISEGKKVDVNGDLSIVDENGVLREDLPDVRERGEAITDALLGSNRRPFPEFLTFRESADGNERIGIHNLEELDLEDGELDLPIQIYGWPPPVPVTAEDILNALGHDVPIEEILDPIDRSRIIYAQSQRLDARGDQRVRELQEEAKQKRWQRRKFYTDEEEGWAPGYTEVDSSDDEAGPANGITSPASVSDSRRPSLRSRSSSKVRFEDSVTDTDYETRSNTSVRSIPVGERWGGFEISEPEKDVGKEVLYQAVQEGFNELLDQLFKEREDLAMEIIATEKERANMKSKIEEAKKAEVPKEILIQNEVDESIFIKEPAVESDESKTDSQTEMLSTEPEPKPPTKTEADPAPANEDPTPRRKEVSFDTPDTDSSSTPDPPPPSSPSPDPTLPQFRPNSPPASPTLPSTLTTPSIATFRTARLAALAAVPLSTTPSSNPPPPSPTPPEPTPSQFRVGLGRIARFALLNDTEAEDIHRGGPGKLSFDEFAKKMVDDDDDSSDEDGDGIGEAKEGKKKWSGGKSAGLGRLGFVGSWIESASF